MRDADRICGLILERFPNEIEIFEDFSPNDRRLYSSYALRCEREKREQILSPKAWAERYHNNGLSFKQIALKLGITQKEATLAYKSAMRKIKKYLRGEK